MMMKEKLIKKFPLTKKVDCEIECYEAQKRRYVIFLDKKVCKENIEKQLYELEAMTKNGFHPKKSLIIVGYTDDEFAKEDLLYFNGIDTFAVYYLMNVNTGEIYFHNQRVFWFSVDWKKIIDRFNEILKE